MPRKEYTEEEVDVACQNAYNQGYVDGSNVIMSLLPNAIPVEEDDFASRRREVRELQGNQPITDKQKEKYIRLRKQVDNNFNPNDELFDGWLGSLTQRLSLPTIIKNCVKNGGFRTPGPIFRNMAL